MRRSRLNRTSCGGCSSRGRNRISPDEKTLIQFLLLGDPSIQPVAGTASVADGASPAGRVAAAAIAAAPGSTVLQRQRRRAACYEIGGMLRNNLPARHAASSRKPPTDVAKEAKRAAAWRLARHLAGFARVWGANRLFELECGIDPDDYLSR